MHQIFHCVFSWIFSCMFLKSLFLDAWASSDIILIGSYTWFIISAPRIKFGSWKNLLVVLPLLVFPDPGLGIPTNKDIIFLNFSCVYSLVFSTTYVCLYHNLEFTIFLFRYWFSLKLFLGMILSNIWASTTENLFVGTL